MQNNDWIYSIEPTCTDELCSESFLEENFNDDNAQSNDSGYFECLSNLNAASNQPVTFDTFQNNVLQEQDSIVMEIPIVCDTICDKNQEQSVPIIIEEIPQISYEDMSLNDICEVSVVQMENNFDDIDNRSDKSMQLHSHITQETLTNKGILSYPIKFIIIYIMYEFCNT